MIDLISRAAAIAWFFRPYSNEESYSNLDVERALKAIPAVDAVPVEWLKSKRKEALHEGMRPDEVEAVEMVLWMWQKEQEAR